MHPSEQSQKRRERRDESTEKHFLMQETLQLFLFFFFKFDKVDTWNVVISAQFHGITMNTWLFALLHLTWPFTADIRQLYIGKWATENCPNYFEKKEIHGFLEPWTPATLCYDRISNVDFREENLKSNIKISISSKQQLHSLICCVFHALVK